jgi:hypothetical protein
LIPAGKADIDLKFLHSAYLDSVSNSFDALEVSRHEPRDVRKGHFVQNSVRIRRYGIVLAALLFGFSLFVTRASEPTNVTMVQLIANPAQFDGKTIRVIGFLRLEFEGNVLYLHREDYENALLGDGIWVDVTSQMTKNSKMLNMHYVLLEGLFSSKGHGHMGMWSGTIKNIHRADVWR